MDTTNTYIYLPEPSEIHSEATNLLRSHGFLITTSLDSQPVEQIHGLFVRTYVHVTATYLDQFPNLRFILKAGVGLDCIDLVTCNEREIQVYNAPGSNANAVAEYILMMALGSLRHIPVHLRRVQEGLWRDRMFLGQELKGKKIGLIGCGAVGRAYARKLQAFDVQILGYDPYIDSQTLDQAGIEKGEFKQVLTASDIVSVHLPLTDQTRNMFTFDVFKLMKKGSLFINVSRGELVIEEDLVRALQEGILAHAVIDVTRSEPQVGEILQTALNLTITPHIAGYTKEADREMSVQAVERFLRAGTNV